MEECGEKSIPTEIEIRLEEEEVGRWSNEGRWSERWKEQEEVIMQISMLISG